VGEELLWIIAGILLIGAELLFANFVVVFIGAASLFTGIAIWFGLPTESGIPFILFAALAVGMIVFLRRRFQQMFKGASLSGDQDDDILGHEATVEAGFDAASPTRGKVSYRGAGWDARCEAGPLARGAFVRIVARQGLTLDVVPIERKELSAP
jgi:membrane protein implicated in regulation of membrane protease activity